MRLQGRITEWRDEKGFGFITPNGGGERVFLHITAFKSRSPRPVGDERVNFVIQNDDRGRPQARQVEYVSQRPLPHSRAGRASIPLLLFASLFLTALGGLTLSAKLPSLLLYLYLGLSVLSFGAYAIDKSAARVGAWRTKESTLQLLALLGGWPGSLIAQQLLRHKSQKQSFQGVFWGALVINLAVFCWFLSPGGVKFLSSIIRW